MYSDMHPMLSPVDWEDAARDPSIVIADGSSVKISAIGGSRSRTGMVNGASLVIKDGPDGKRERVISKVPATVKRLVILGSHGYISLDAKRWLADAGISWAHIETGGTRVRTLGVSGGDSSPRLMRRQAMCAPGLPLAETGLAINRRFIAEKLENQAWNCQAMLGNRVAADYIRAQIELLPSKHSIESIRGLEGDGAAMYWSAWHGYPIRWSYPRPNKAHWQSFGHRKTLVHTWETNKDATDPINAVLNFAYHIAEIECVLACHAAGLSPVMGISHADKAGRDSFALDLVEVLRPWVDQAVLSVFKSSMDKRWFSEVRRGGKEGVVEIMAPLTHRIVTEVHAMASKLQPAINYTVDALNG
jgi:CRISPR-associated endonuclease Cas1